MKVDWLVVGAGFTGSVIAERIASQLNQRVLLVERRSHIGGNAYDEYDDHGVLVHRYGPHIFHTNSLKVWEYLSKFTAWRSYQHRVLALVEGKLVPVPFNLNSLYALFPSRLAERLEEKLVWAYGFGSNVPILRLRQAEDPQLRLLAEYVYRNVFEKYTLKQWNLSPEELDPSVTGRVPVRISRDDRYFQDSYQGLPQQGYTALFRNMLADGRIRVLLNTDYRDVVGCVKFNRMVYTGPLDAFFDYVYGPLPYRSLRFDFRHYRVREFQPVAQVNFPNEKAYTRITEFKHLTGQCHGGTTVAYEYPEAYEFGRNEPYYPIPRQEYRVLYERYRKEAERLKGSVVFVGRLADYRYYNMDQAVARALKVFEEEVCTRAVSSQ